MSDTLIGLMFAAGVAGYVFAKVSRSVGNGNAKTASMAAAITFVIAFIFLFTFTKYVLHI